MMLHPISSHRIWPSQKSVAPFEQVGRALPFVLIPVAADRVLVEREGKNRNNV